MPPRGRAGKSPSCFYMRFEAWCAINDGDDDKPQPTVLERQLRNAARDGLLPYELPRRVRRRRRGTATFFRRSVQSTTVDLREITPPGAARSPRPLQRMCAAS